jgi:hypothetical protein
LQQDHSQANLACFGGNKDIALDDLKAIDVAWDGHGRGKWIAFRQVDR